MSAARSPVANEERLGATRADRRWKLAWLTLTVAVAGHVVDEALNDFLSFYNPTIEGLRETIPWLPFRPFTFEGWISGLTVGILALAALTPLAGGGRWWMRGLSWVYGVLMTLNAFIHLGGSLALGRWLPGVISSPFMLGAAIFLLASVPRPRPSRSG